MTSESPPTARVRVRHRWKNKELPNAMTGRIEKVRVHVGEETVREAWCAIHERWSPHFTGSNEHGWVFGCKGKTEEDETQNDRYAHYFLALPPSADGRTTAVQR